MIRIGYIPQLTSEWIGGINYYRNLLSILVEECPEVIEPVLVCGDGIDKALLKGFPDLPVINTSGLKRFRPSWFVAKIMARLFHKDFLLERLLKKNKIELMSHWFIPVESFAISTLCWIPDFQHVRLPTFFSPQEIQRRDATIKNAVKYSTGVLLSSHNAYNDLKTLFPQYADKAKVLQFVVDYPKVEFIPEIHHLECRYGFTGPYLHLPNQFWIHKNHQIVIKSLSILKQQGKRVQVLATGNTNDYRQPGHFTQLMAEARELKVVDYFRVLGVIPYEDLVGLMTHSVAMINPSLFEGWSTTVEEGKTLGKKIILSDIVVHREQNPDRGIYFDPHSAEQLAEILWEAWTAYDPAAELSFAAKAKALLPARRKRFAENYLEIVRDLLAK